MAYVYKHIRLDTDEVFYIGIGSDDKFTRAYSKKRRSKFWKDLTKSIKYKVEIIYNNVSWEEACQKEIELIKLYGRRDLGLGTLCNLTNGGDGVNGYKHNKDRLLKISNNSKGSKNPNSKSCIHFDTLMKFNSLKEGCKYFNLKYYSQSSAIRNKQSTAQFYFENEYFKRPTREEISKKLGALRTGDKNHRFGKPAWNKNYIKTKNEKK